MKVHVSRYVQDVKRGDEIIISERGKPVARIVPIAPPSERSRLHSLQRLASEGENILPTTLDKPKKPVSRMYFKRKAQLETTSPKLSQMGWHFRRTPSEKIIISLICQCKHLPVSPAVTISINIFKSSQVVFFLYPFNFFRTVTIF